MACNLDELLHNSFYNAYTMQPHQQQGIALASCNEAGKPFLDRFVMEAIPVKGAPESYTWRTSRTTALRATAREFRPFARAASRSAAKASLPESHSTRRI